MPDLVSILLPIATLVLGASGTLLAEGLRDKRAARREAALLVRQREQNRMDRRDSFELANLSATYANLSALARAVAVFHLIDMDAARRFSVDYASRQLTGIPNADEAGETMMLANRELRNMTLLLLDNDLRELCLASSGMLNLVAVGPKTIAQADQDFNAAVAHADQSQARLADRIRQLYSV